MDYIITLTAIFASISGSLGRSLADLDENGTDGMDPLLPLATMLVGVAMGICLLVVIALCACGDSPKVVDPPATEQASPKANGGETMASQSSVNSPHPSSPTANDPSTTLTTSLSLSHAPPSPSNGGGPSPTMGQPPSPNNLLRASTIERRLPELPPIPPKVPDIGESAENDYNGTYDTIKDEKKKEMGAGGAKASVAKTTNAASVGEVDDDPAYNSVEETMRAGSLRKDGGGGMGGAVTVPGGGVAAAGGGAGMADGDVVEDDYACVKDTSPTSGNGIKSPVEGATGDADETDYDSSYAKVKDFQGAGNGNHAYATVGDKRLQDKEHGYARVKDVHRNNTAAQGAGGGAASSPQGAMGGSDVDDEEVPPVPHKPLDLDSPVHPSSPVSQRAASVSTPGSPDQGRSGLGPHSGPQGGGAGPGGPDGDGPGPVWVQGPDNGPIGPNGRVEPPYTQVSARESLESIRARQQLDHTQKTEEVLGGPASAGVSATGGVTAVASAGGGGAGGEPDFDGIYEQVDDNSVRGQNNTSPPPLPRGRQTFHAITSRRVYEEITEDNRPRPPGGASNYNDDPEPYAVVDKTMTEHRPQEASSNSNGNHVESGKPETKDFDQLYAKVNKSGNQDEGPRKPPTTQQPHHANNNNHKRESVEEDDDFGALYAKVNKNRKTVALMETRTPHVAASVGGGVSGGAGGGGVNLQANTAALNSVYGMNGQTQLQGASGMDSYSDIYADVDENPPPPPTGTAGGTMRIPITEPLTVENNYQSIDEDDMAPRSPVDDRLIHISSHHANPDLWVRREHTYQAVEDNAAKKKKTKSKHGKGATSGDEEGERRERLEHNYESVRPTEPAGPRLQGSTIMPKGGRNVEANMSVGAQAGANVTAHIMSKGSLNVGARLEGSTYGSSIGSNVMSNVGSNAGSNVGSNAGINVGSNVGARQEGPNLRSPEGSQALSPDGSKVKPNPPTRRLSKEERVAGPALVKVKMNNTNNNHIIETLPMKETRI